MVATGVEPNQRSNPNPMKAGNENPTAMVVTFAAHSTPTATADRDPGCRATHDSRFPGGAWDTASPGH